MKKTRTLFSILGICCLSSFCGCSTSKVENDINNPRAFFEIASTLEGNRIQFTKNGATELGFDDEGYIGLSFFQQLGYSKSTKTEVEKNNCTTYACYTIFDFAVDGDIFRTGTFIFQEDGFVRLLYDYDKFHYPQFYIFYFKTDGNADAIWKDFKSLF